MMIAAREWRMDRRELPLLDLALYSSAYSSQTLRVQRLVRGDLSAGYGGGTKR